MERPNPIRPAGRLALLAAGFLLCSQGCRSTKSEVPPGKPYQTSGTPPTVGFSNDPHPNTSAGMAGLYGNKGPGALVSDGRGTPPASGDLVYGTPPPASANLGVPTNNLYGRPGTSGSDGLDGRRTGGTRGFAAQDDGPGVTGPGQGSGDGSRLDRLAGRQLPLIAGAIGGPRRARAGSMPDLLDVLFEDEHCLAVVKPAGQFVQGGWAPPGESTLEQVVRRHLDPQDPGSVYVGIVHRLDRPVSGVLLWAKTSKAARRLSSQFQRRTAVKEYWAIVESADAGGTLEPPASQPAGRKPRGAGPTG